MYQDIGKLSHELAYAADSDIVSSVVTATSIEPVRQHIQRLVEAGLGIDRIAALSGMGPPGLDLFQTGRIPEIPGYQARKIMTIDVP